MTLITPVCPVELPETISHLIRDYCPISQTENVDEETDPEFRSEIYKFVGFCKQEVLDIALRKLVPDDYKLLYRVEGILSMYEAINGDNVGVFWFDHVLFVLVSSDESQHEAVMNFYSDTSALLTQVQNDQLTNAIWQLIRGKQVAKANGEKYDKDSEPVVTINGRPVKWQNLPKTSTKSE